MLGQSRIFRYGDSVVGNQRTAWTSAPRAISSIRLSSRIDVPLHRNAHPINTQLVQKRFPVGWHPACGSRSGLIFWMRKRRKQLHTFDRDHLLLFVIVEPILARLEAGYDPDYGFPHGDARLDLTDLYAFPKPGDRSKSILIMNVHPSFGVNPQGPTSHDARFIPIFVHSLEHTGGYSGEGAKQAAGILLPDLLPYNPSKPASYPANGWIPTDDAIDVFLSILTNGKVTRDNVGPHTDLLTVFPYVGAPHKSRSAERVAA
jgi:hypothetical protein